MPMDGSIELLSAYVKELLHGSTEIQDWGLKYSELIFFSKNLTSSGDNQ